MSWKCERIPLLCHFQGSAMMGPSESASSIAVLYGYFYHILQHTIHYGVKTSTIKWFFPTPDIFYMEGSWNRDTPKSSKIEHMGMDQYLLIPFLGGWTSINPSYFDVHQGHKVLTHCHIFVLKSMVTWGSAEPGWGWTLMRSWSSPTSLHPERKRAKHGALTTVTATAF